MAFPTIKLLAPAPFWQGQTYSGASYTAGSDGIINAASNDVPNLLQAGCNYAIQRHATYITPGGPATASATVTVTSVTIIAGSTTSLTIAAQPDMPRQLVALAYGTMTAGLLTMTYTANDSTTQVDALTIGGTFNPMTVTTTKGVVHLTSAVYSGCSAGTTPGIEIGTNAYIAVPLEPGFVDWSILKESKVTTTGTTWVSTDETVSTSTVSTGLVSPTTAPGSSVWLAFDYVYNMPA